MHSLQRAIHNGMITAKHGRTTEQLGAISGALSLLATIIMPWSIGRTANGEVLSDPAGV